MRRIITPKEQEIIDMLGFGYSDDEIAKELGVTKGTIIQHITLLYRKLHVDSGISRRYRMTIAAKEMTSGYDN